MSDSADRLRLVLGVKLKQLRQERGFTLGHVAARAGVSVSYLSEIEKGKKYPKPAKLVDLASALGVAYDDLVSLKVAEPLEELRELIYSPFLRAFPFELFGVEPQDVVSLMAGVPRRAGALIRAFVEVSRTYDARVEHFLFAALRAYQQMHGNVFPALEAEAEAVRRERGWDARAVPVAHVLRHLLEADHGYRIDDAALAGHPTLGGLRSVYLAPEAGAAPGTPEAAPRLLVNGRLHEEQLAFLYAREIGFLRLRPAERPTTSSWLRVASFEQVLANFEASYVAGALLIPQAAFDADLATFFARPAWSERAFRRALAHYRATPEMFFYRLTQRVPEAFGLREIFFMRFHRTAGGDEEDAGDGDTYRLTKVLNMSRVPVPHGIRLDEHYCRRWGGMAALRRLAETRAEAARAAAEAAGAPPPDSVVTVQRMRFLSDDAEFFVLAVARPLVLQPGTDAVVMAGFLVDGAFKRAVRFWDDPAIPRVDVGLTCERCPLATCAVRAAPPTILDAERRQDEQEAALAALADVFEAPAGDGAAA